MYEFIFCPPAFIVAVRREYCDKCGRSYSKKANLDRHKKYECEVDRNFSCPVCPYKAKRKEHLKRHMIFIHSVILKPTDNPQELLMQSMSSL